MSLLHKTSTKTQNVFFAGTILLVGIIYTVTLAPSVIQIDSGELAAVQTTLGIAHPTGYPLFALFGHLVSKIPLGISKIIQLNYLAAAWCVIAVILFHRTATRWLSQISPAEKVKNTFV